MSKIEFSRNNLHKFLVLCTLQKSAETKELLAKFSPTDITTYAHSPGKYVSFKGVLKGKFDVWGDVGIDDSTFLRNFINSQSDDSIFLKKTENKLISESNNVKFTAALRNPKYITNIFPQDKYDQFKDAVKGNEVKLKKEEVKKIISYSNMIKDNQFISLVGSKGKFNVIIGDVGNELDLSFDTDKNLNDFSVKVNNLFIEILSLLSDTDVTISTAKDATCVYVSAQYKEIEFEYFIGLVKK